jgi:hypothetical protein
VANYKKARYVCTVEADEDGKLVFVLEDGKRFKSPSSAASAVMGGSAANGWRFWSLEGQEPKAQATEPAAAKPARTATKKAKKLIFKSPSQAGVAEGKTKWFCSACMKSFDADGDAEPQVCPEGHRIDDPELTGTVGTPEPAAKTEEGDGAGPA